MEGHRGAGGEGGGLQPVTVPGCEVQGEGLVSRGASEALQGGSRGDSASSQASGARMAPHWLSAFLAGTNRCMCGSLHLACPLPECQGGHLVHPECHWGWGGRLIQGGCVGRPECQGGLHFKGREGGAGGAALNLHKDSRIDAQQSPLLAAEQGAGSSPSAPCFRDRGMEGFLDTRNPGRCSWRGPSTRTFLTTPRVVAPSPGGLVTMSRSLHRQHHFAITVTFTAESHRCLFECFL